MRASDPVKKSKITVEQGDVNNKYNLFELKWRGLGAPLGLSCVPTKITFEPYPMSIIITTRVIDEKDAAALSQGCRYWMGPYKEAEPKKQYWTIHAGITRLTEEKDQCTLRFSNEFEMKQTDLRYRATTPGERVFLYHFQKAGNKPPSPIKYGNGVVVVPVGHEIFCDDWLKIQRDNNKIPTWLVFESRSKLKESRADKFQKVYDRIKKVLKEREPIGGNKQLVSYGTKNETIKREMICTAPVLTIPCLFNGVDSSKDQQEAMKMSGKMSTVEKCYHTVDLSTSEYGKINEIKPAKDMRGKVLPPRPPLTKSGRPFVDFSSISRNYKRSELRAASLQGTQIRNDMPSATRTCDSAAPIVAKQPKMMKVNIAIPIENDIKGTKIDHMAATGLTAPASASKNAVKVVGSRVNKPATIPTKPSKSANFDFTPVGYRASPRLPPPPAIAKKVKISSPVVKNKQF